MGIWYFVQRLFAGWWYTYPSKKYESQLGGLFPKHGKMKNVPNHQPVCLHADEVHGRILILKIRISAIEYFFNLVPRPCHVFVGEHRHNCGKHLFTLIYPCKALRCSLLRWDIPSLSMIEFKLGLANAFMSRKWSDMRCRSNHPIPFMQKKTSKLRTTSVLPWMLSTKKIKFSSTISV